MIWIGLILLVIAGIAEHYKDLSEEGKLDGYWDKNHPANFLTAAHLKDANRPQWLHFSFFSRETQQWIIEYWWKVHWLQGGLWDKIPVWIRQYLSFRDGWHLLKFVSLNSFALGIVLLAEFPWWWFLIIRACFSLPETILRFYETRN